MAMTEEKIKEILRLSVETGVCDPDLSCLGGGRVATEYGDATDEIIKFAQAIEKMVKDYDPV